MAKGRTTCGSVAAAALLLFAAVAALAAAEPATSAIPGAIGPEPTLVPKPPPAKEAAANGAALAPAGSAVLAKPAPVPKDSAPPKATLVLREAPAPKPAVVAKPPPAPKAAAGGAAAGAATTFASSANATAAPQPAPCDKPCFTVADYWPYKTCRAECSPDVCKRGWGVWTSQEICCAAGTAFPDGCSERPAECWVAEAPASRTCWRDDRKCLQGYGVYPSREACCAPGSAFPDGCKKPNTTAAASNTTCWIVDTYFPARLCRSTPNLCSPESGVQSWPTQAACCARGGAFSEGCSPAPPPTPCYTVGSHWPSRTCVASNDIAVCNRGWGVYASEEICCAPNVAFSEGCSAPKAAEEDAPASAATVALKSVAAKADPDILK